MEEWRPVWGFEGKYEVSNQGRLKNVQEGAGHVTGRILKPGLNLGGYLQCDLGAYGGRHSLHLLVMQAHVGQKPEGLEINHKNGNKTDNRLENLEYCTKSENDLHKTRVLGTGRGESHGNAKITEDDVREIRRLAADGITQREIAKRFNLTHPNVGYIVRRTAWSHVK